MDFQLRDSCLLWIVRWKSSWRDYGSRHLCCLGDAESPSGRDHSGISQFIQEKSIPASRSDDIRAALATMSANKVRPVVRWLMSYGELLAILSLDDIILHAQVQDTSRPLDISSEDVMNTLK